MKKEISSWLVLEHVKVTFGIIYPAIPGCIVEDDVLVRGKSLLKVTVNVFDTKFGFRSLKAELLTESR